MKRFSPLLAVLLVAAAFPVAAQRHDHSHEDLFDVTGRIDRDVNDGKLSRAEGLHQKALLLRAPHQMKAAYRPVEGTHFKCGTPLVVELESARKKGLLLPETAALMDGEQPGFPETKATFISPSGKFEFTYFTTGTNAIPAVDNNGNSIPDYVEWAAMAADSSWRQMVGRQRYRDMVLSSSRYQFRFMNSTSLYGVTYPSGATTRIELNKDFVGFPGNTHPEGQQKGALLATVGHELKHAVQYMYGGWDKDSGQFLEMDATLYEDVNFPNVNDYFNYLNSSSSILRNPALTLYGASYERATWAMFFYEKYGITFWPQVWEEVGGKFDMYMNNIATVSVSRGSTFLNDMIESHLYHLAVGDTVSNSAARSLRNFGFQDRLFFPTFTNSVTTFTSATAAVVSSVTINGLAARHVQVRPQPSDTGNVYLSMSYNQAFAGMGVVVQRLDRSHRVYMMPARAGIGFVELRLPERWENVRNVLGVVVNADPTTSSASLASQHAVTVGFEITNKAMIPVTNEQPVRSFELALAQNFPNPFNPATTIRFSLPQREAVRLDIFDTSGRLVASPLAEIRPAGQHEITFDASALSSGVYLYRLSSTSGVIVKRMTLLK